VDIFYKARANEKFISFLSENTALPMMFMDDAIRATIELMEAPKERIIERSSYNLAALSFSPEELALAIKKQLPNFEIEYNPDFRQKIAESWPNSIDDSAAKRDWGWQHQFDMESMVEIMLENVAVTP
jgi:nucleoside-diphosphate-sugar epimerase